MTANAPDVAAVADASSDVSVDVAEPDSGPTADAPEEADADPVDEVAAPDPCAQQPCANGGECSVVNDAFECSCAPDFEGPTCEQQIDDCIDVACLNGGHCVDGTGGAVCSCPPGFSGADCGTDIDDCAGSPCINGGTCVDEVSGFSCSCAPGFVGAKCQTDLNECASAPCLNFGACTDLPGGYQCSCPPGFGGTNCEIDSDECADAACPDGATCVDGANAFECVCAPGTFGPECAPCTCDAGMCDDGSSGDGHCAVCDAGFTGLDCDQPCPTGGCAGAVSCDQSGKSLVCSECVPGFFGTSCVAPCAQGNCVGVVSCAQDGTERSCGECAPGFWGPACESACPQSNCVGQATCNSSTGGEPSCEACAPGFQQASSGCVVQDADGDTVPDDNDGCPEDPLKSSPGTCGCGVTVTPDGGCNQKPVVGSIDAQVVGPGEAVVVSFQVTDPDTPLTDLEIVVDSSDASVVSDPVAHGCLKTQGKAGCDEDPQCETAVCAVDSFCCSGVWDNACGSCAAGAQGYGGLDCSGVTQCVKEPTSSLLVTALGGSGSVAEYALEITPSGSGASDITVFASDGFSLASRTFALTVSGPPVLSLSPPGQVLAPAQSPLVLKCASDSSPQPTWSWTWDGAPIPGADQGTLTVNSVTAADAGVYRCTATNALGEVTSGPVQVIVDGPPVITNLEPVETTEDTTAVLAFRAEDAWVTPEGLTASVTSGDPTLLSPAGITLVSAEDGDFVFELQPKPDAHGEAKLKIVVSDGISSATYETVLTVAPACESDALPPTAVDASRACGAPGQGQSCVDSCLTGKVVATFSCVDAQNEAWTGSAATADACAGGALDVWPIEAIDGVEDHEVSTRAVVELPPGVDEPVSVSVQSSEPALVDASDVTVTESACPRPRVVSLSQVSVAMDTESDWAVSFNGQVLWAPDVPAGSSVAGLGDRVVCQPGDLVVRQGFTVVGKQPVRMAGGQPCGANADCLSSSCVVGADGAAGQCTEALGGQSLSLSADTPTLSATLSLTVRGANVRTFEVQIPPEADANGETSLTLAAQASGLTGERDFAVSFAPACELEALDEALPNAVHGCGPSLTAVGSVCSMRCGPGTIWSNGADPTAVSAVCGPDESWTVDTGGLVCVVDPATILADPTMMDEGTLGENLDACPPVRHVQRLESACPQCALNLGDPAFVAASFAFSGEAGAHNPAGAAAWYADQPAASPSTCALTPDCNEDAVWVSERAVVRATLFENPVDVLALDVEAHAFGGMDASKCGCDQAGYVEDRDPRVETRVRLRTFDLGYDVEEDVQVGQWVPARVGPKTFPSLVNFCATQSDKLKKKAEKAAPFLADLPWADLCLGIVVTAGGRQAAAPLYGAPEWFGVDSDGRIDVEAKAQASLSVGSEATLGGSFWVDLRLIDAQMTVDLEARRIVDTCGADDGGTLAISGKAVLELSTLSGGVHVQGCLASLCASAELFTWEGEELGEITLFEWDDKMIAAICSDAEDCPSGYVCHEERCVEQVGPGVQCDGPIDCETGLCWNPDAALFGMCLACEDSEDCPSGFACLAPEPLVSYAGECDDSGQCDDHGDCGGLFQGGSLDGWCDLGGWCQPKEPIGSYCGVNEDFQCQSGNCLGLACAACDEHGDCTADQYCTLDFPDEADSECAARRPVGASCGSSVECLSEVCEFGTCVECTNVPATGCDFGTEYCEFGTCHPKVAFGEACAFSDQCQGPNVCEFGVCLKPCSEGCAAHEFCDLTVCQPKAGIGGTCPANDAGCFNGICDTSICVECVNFPAKEGCNFEYEYCEGGSCHPRAGFDEACAFSDQCLSPYVCEFGTCKKPCSAGCSPSEFCDLTICQPKQPVGGACPANDAGCTSGICDTSECVECVNAPVAEGCDFEAEYCEFGACHPKVGFDQACAFSDQCLSPNVCEFGTCKKPCSAGCSSSEFCDLTICQPKQPTGEPCPANDAGCLSGICDTATCVECVNFPSQEGCNFTTHFCEFQECKPKAGFNEACDFSDQCSAPYVCEFGTCKKPCSAGCSGSEFCDTTICQPKKDNGQSCLANDSACKSGICDTSVCVQCVRLPTPKGCNLSSQYCENATCKTKKGNGGSCPASDGYCQSGICDTNTCVQCVNFPSKEGCNFQTQYCEGAQCKNKGGKNASCGFSDQCLNPMVCEFGSCQKPCSAGCSSAEFCDTTICVSKKNSGAGCINGAECKSGCCADLLWGFCSPPGIAGKCS